MSNVKNWLMSTYVDVRVEHVLEVLGRDGGHFVDQVHEETAHAVICRHLSRLGKSNQIIGQGFSLSCVSQGQDQSPTVALTSTSSMYASTVVSMSCTLDAAHPTWDRSEVRPLVRLGVTRVLCRRSTGTRRKSWLNMLGVWVCSLLDLDLALKDNKDILKKFPAASLVMAFQRRFVDVC